MHATNGFRTALCRIALSALAIWFATAVPSAQAINTVTAVEYYYAAWNYYFETSFTDEIAALDAGAFGGVWQRTGQTFQVWPQSAGLGSPACRFFSITFAPKSSHFYTPFAAECAGVKVNPNWQYEGIAFYIQLANANGYCPGGTMPLYRLYNNGMGGAPNHRYTTSPTIFNQMVAAGWVFEGNGNTKVFACVPQDAAPPPPTVAKPNLTPYQPTGWSAPIVVSTVSGSTTDSSPLYSTDTLYVNWAIDNNGTASATVVDTTYLYLDGVMIQSWTNDSPIASNYYETPVVPPSIGTLAAGNHTLKLVADSTNVIGESNEVDNTYTKTFYVQQGIVAPPCSTYGIPTGTLNIIVDPYVQIWLNGSYYGEGQVILQGIVAGAYQFEGIGGISGHTCYSGQVIVYACKVNQYKWDTGCS
jgi:hypothetical protein